MNENANNMCKLIAKCDSNETNKCIYFKKSDFGSSEKCKYFDTGLCYSGVAISNIMLLALKEITGKEITLHEVGGEDE